jgi:hypothetical protein
MRIKLFEDFSDEYFKELTDFSVIRQRKDIDFTDLEIERLISVFEKLNVQVDKKSREELKFSSETHLKLFKEKVKGTFFALISLERWFPTLSPEAASKNFWREIYGDKSLIIKVFRKKIPLRFGKVDPKCLDIKITKLEDEWFLVHLIYHNPDLFTLGKGIKTSNLDTPHVLTAWYECDQFSGIEEFIKKLFNK